MQPSTADPEVRKEIRYVTRFFAQFFRVQLLLDGHDRTSVKKDGVRVLIARIVRYKIPDHLRERFIRIARSRFGSCVDFSAMLENEYRRLEFERERNWHKK